MSVDASTTSASDWLRMRRDQETGIESVHAHFQGHAYDPHDHDEMLVGITQQGVQQFSCNRSLHVSTPGRAMLIEPGAVHDGHAPEKEGFTYAMLYLPQSYVSGMTERLGLGDASALQAAFHHTLTDDAQLIGAIQQAFLAVHQNEGRLARDQGLDQLLARLSRHLYLKAPSLRRDSPLELQRARDFLHAQMAQDVSLEELATYSGVDRFRLTRQFKKAFGQSPHAYLVRLRLRAARALLAQGMAPVEVAAEVGFADQSHLGVWFRRAFRMTPAAYRKQCTNLTD
ncbi:MULTISPECIES: AraC family transcriptional regulator [unclassified Pseudomonas]|uniref:AraC family transcriptional regulator n=1 Tax=unclassified Pseudomonas TaxID=196821 RepID=UPI0021C74082|nr:MULTISPECIES: AraC family transcriptional regulator [unclassified Pseudomonas]MCU1734491.1 AraC family transcriptional regulator [Pseudomonas sp. 20P_3.2_Bac4]MCU1745532.1 AraC family transcriptional regulator [Pseudomonas sp. 20P_3.2_Bac5]